MEKLIQIVAICHLFTSCITSEVHVDLIDDIPRSNRGPLKDTSPLNLKSFGGEIEDSVKLGNFIYQSRGTRGISLLDVTNLSTPIILKQNIIQTPSFDLRVESNILFVASGNKGITLFDISNPEIPILISTIDFQNSIEHIKIHDNFLIALNGSDIDFWDITTPQIPQKQGSYTASADVIGMSFKNDYGFIYELGIGIQTIDFSDQLNILPVGTPLVIPGLFTNSHMEVLNNSLIIGYTYNTLNGATASADITDPLNLSLLDADYLYNRGEVLDLKIDGNDVYYATGVSHSMVAEDYPHGVDVYDFSNPSDFQFKGHFVNSSPINSIDLDGSNIIASSATNGVSIYDRSTLSKAPVLVSYLGSNSFTNSIKFYGTNLIIADGANGLRVIDASDPTSLAYIGTENTTGNSYKVEIGTNHAYLADLTGGFNIIDLSIVSNPNSIAIYPSNTYDVKINSTETRAYISNALTSGIDILNITDKTSPALIDTIPYFTGALSFDIDNDDLIISNGTGIDILDVTTDELNPSTIGSLSNIFDPADNGIIDIEIYGNRLYVTTNQSFYVIDISSKINPILLGQFSKQNWYNQGFSIINSNYAMLGGSSEFIILDLTDITDIKQIWLDTDPHGHVREIITDGTHAFVANSFTGVKVYTASEFPQTKTAGFDMIGNVTQLSLKDDKLFFTDEFYGIGAIDYTIKNKPKLLSNSQNELDARDLHSFDNYVASADVDSGFTLFDYSDTEAPTKLSSAGEISGFDCYDIHIISQNILCAHKNLGIRIYDISNPLIPFRTATVYSGNIENFLYEDGFIYTAEKSVGFSIFDAQNLSTPIELSTYDTVGAVVAIAKHSKGLPFLYMADSTNGIIVFNISDKSAPNLVKTIAPTGTSILDVKTFDSYLFARDNTNGILVFDISTPANPILLSTIKTKGNMNDFVYNEKVLYIADGPQGITLVNLENPKSPIISY